MNIHDTLPKDQLDSGFMSMGTEIIDHNFSPSYYDDIVDRYDMFLSFQSAAIAGNVLHSERVEDDVFVMSVRAATRQTAFEDGIALALMICHEGGVDYDITSRIEAGYPIVSRPFTLDFRPSITQFYRKGLQLLRPYHEILKQFGEGYGQVKNDPSLGLDHIKAIGFVIHGAVQVAKAE